MVNDLLLYDFFYYSLEHCLKAHLLVFNTINQVLELFEKH